MIDFKNEPMNETMEEVARIFIAVLKEKSAYLGEHCEKVPIITMMLAKMLMGEKTGPFASFTLSKDELKELELASYLHDCGKLITPDYIMDKKTKLEKIFDRIELLLCRIQVMYKEYQIQYLRKKITKAQYASSVKELKEISTFLQRVNIGGEYLEDADRIKLKELALRMYFKNNRGKIEKLITPEELENLLISRGTLNMKERDIVNKHVYYTQELLKLIHFPRHLQKVPEIAGNHHEQINGKGHPNGLKGDQISIQSRILAIAEIFEALSDSSRPYKKGKTLEECFNILEKMAAAGQIDSDIFDTFVRSEVPVLYAKQYLKQEQCSLGVWEKLPNKNELEKKIA